MYFLMYVCVLMLGCTVCSFTVLISGSQTFSNTVKYVLDYKVPLGFKNKNDIFCILYFCALREEFGEKVKILHQDEHLANGKCSLIRKKKIKPDKTVICNAYIP